MFKSHQMGETGVCRIQLVPLKGHRSFSWIPDKRGGAGDNGNNGINGEESKRFHMESSTRPVCAM